MAYNPVAIQSAYDQIADREDEFEKGFSLRNEIPREFIKKYLQASDVVLDAGGGTGLNAIMMAQRCKRVTLVDISPRILARAAVNIRNAGLTGKIDLVEGDISHLARFGDAEFSFMVCVGGSLSYILEKAPQAIREFIRVARSGATLIVGCDSKYGFVRWLVSRHQLDEAMRVYRASQYEAGEGAYARLYTVAELTGMLEAAGWQVLEVASTPTLVDSWEQTSYPEDKRQALMALELEVCTEPELLGTGHHLFCIARKV